MSGCCRRLFGIDKLNVPRSDIPAVTNVAWAARIQAGHRETNPRFKARTGCLVIVNISLNVRGGLDIGVGRAVLDP